MFILLIILIYIDTSSHFLKENKNNDDKTRREETKEEEEEEVGKIGRVYIELLAIRKRSHIKLTLFFVPTYPDSLTLVPKGEL